MALSLVLVPNPCPRLLVSNLLLGCFGLTLLLGTRVGFQYVPDQFRVLLPHWIVLSHRRHLARLVGFLPLLPRHLRVKAILPLSFLSEELWLMGLRRGLVGWRVVVGLRFGGVVPRTFAEEPVIGGIAGISDHYFLFIPWEYRLSPFSANPTGTLKKKKGI